MFLRKISSAILAVLAVTAVCYAQQEPASTQEKIGSGQEGPRASRRHGRIGRHRGFAGMRELDLTEDQRQQQRAIMQRQLEKTKAQREELFKLREKRITGTVTPEDETRVQSLRREIRDSMQGVRTEMEGVLTAEQRARLEQLKTNARRGVMKCASIDANGVNIANCCHDSTSLHRMARPSPQRSGHFACAP